MHCTYTHINTLVSYKQAIQWLPGLWVMQPVHQSPCLSTFQSYQFTFISSLLPCSWQLRQQHVYELKCLTSWHADRNMKGCLDVVWMKISEACVVSARLVVLVFPKGSTGSSLTFVCFAFPQNTIQPSSRKCTLQNLWNSTTGKHVLGFI